MLFHGYCGFACNPLLVPLVKVLPPLSLVPGLDTKYRSKSVMVDWLLLALSGKTAL